MLTPRELAATATPRGRVRTSRLLSVGQCHRGRRGGRGTAGAGAVPARPAGWVRSRRAVAGRSKARRTAANAAAIASEAWTTLRVTENAAARAPSDRTPFSATERAI